ncbi:Proprotein convertase subtilisin/kexin type 7 [Labeo rohita]|uniref:Proprotein convertase subtilisin/kexin type 7 n=1 Tax=Labeo rohita TaxID=84645 RepID=A0ABQ8M127_LABRO|nr:Proprotein convertase subtilisin/kexin type 7 [Labeo rohita]
MCLSLYHLLLLTISPLHSHSFFFPSQTSSSCGPGRSWAVRLDAGSVKAGHSLDRLAQSVAEEVGLENHGQIGQLEGHYLLCQGLENSADADSHSTMSALDQNPHVLWHSQEHILRRSKRSHNDVKHGMDINVTGVWERNITGVGITVVVVDDGVQHTLADIQPNYSPEGSYDLNSNDPDPMPHPDSHSDNHHGTRCAGEIAAVSNNSFCAVGVAYGSKAALQHGVIAGRRGFGSIFVVASGNGGQYEDNCNYDGYANSIYTVTIGTSAAAPLAAGMVALMLQVRPCLSWRDHDGDVQADWGINGAGFHHSHKYGFGLLNAWRLVNAAKSELRQSGMQTLEHVSVTVTIVHPRRGERGDLAHLSKWNELADRSQETAGCSSLSSGVLKQWKITLYGSSLSHQQVKERQRVVEDAMGGQYLNSSFALPCPPGIDVPPEIVSPFTSSSLKSLLLLGCFALFWSLYYTLEVTLTHWDWRGCSMTRTGRDRGFQAASMGLEDSQVVEIQPELDNEAKVPLIAADENT